MSQKVKHQKKQEQQEQQKQQTREQTQVAPDSARGPKPIKVLAIGIGILLIIVASANILMGSLESRVATADTGAGTASAGETQPLGGSIAPTKDGVQEVAITMQGRTYQPSPIRVKVGVPVRFTVDLNTVGGCYRTIVISELGVSGRVSSGNNIIEFTPTKTGTFRMTCGMGMADGTIIVEDANGQAPPAKAQGLPTSAAGAGSCGGSGSSGGCGCGGG